MSSIIFDYIFFILGFLILLKGADLLVTGSASLAKKMKISDIVVGLTIVSIGTSAPELFVNIIASLEGNAGIGIGNVFGSNIANILLILGVSAIIYPIPVKQNTILTEIPFSLTATLLVGFLANASLFHVNELDTIYITRTLYISNWDGVILLCFFLLFMSYIIKIANEQAYKEKIYDLMGKNDKVKDDGIQILTTKKTVFFLVLGMIGLFFGGKWVVEGAVVIAKQFGMSDSLVGLTIIAIGTSLPELVTSATAAFKKKTDIAVGNVVGSNIFNMLWILGISSVIKPLPFDVISNVDLLIIVAASALLIFSLSIGKKYFIERWNGYLFVSIYILYILYLINREANFIEWLALY